VPPSPSARLDAVREFLAAPRCAVLTVLDASGAPHPAVVHYLVAGGSLLVNGRADRRWVGHLLRDDRVSVVVHDAADDQHWVGLKGTAELLRTGPEAVEDAMSIARRYGEDPEAFGTQERVSFRVVPGNVSEYGGRASS
jgi:PPOX class probable F420-dependent enzyme